MEDGASDWVEIAPAVTPEMTVVIGGGLADFNRAMAGYGDGRELAVVLRDGRTGAVLGGLLGRTTLGLLFIDLVFLPEGARGRGVGARLVEMAEREAVARGCSAAVLFTIVFQAPAFYARLGYWELGRVEVAAPGATRVCMSKQLVGAVGGVGGGGVMGLEDEIRRVLEAKAAALVGRDAAGLAGLLHSEFVYVNARGRRFDRAGYIEAYCGSGEVVFVEQEISDLCVSELDACAVATLSIHDELLVGERAVTGRYRSLCVFSRGDGRWLWAAGQTMAV